MTKYKIYSTSNDKHKIEVYVDGKFEGEFTTGNKAIIETLTNNKPLKTWMVLFIYREINFQEKISLEDEVQLFVDVPVIFTHLDDSRTETIEGYNFDLEVEIHNGCVFVYDLSDKLSVSQLVSIEDSIDEYSKKDVEERLSKKDKREGQYYHNY